MIINNFRKLNNNEKKAVKKTLNRNGIKLNVNALKVAYSNSNNFTVCQILDNENNCVRLGTSKRNPKDKENPEIGKALALNRALKN